jgi:hypothetical protein
MGHLAAAAVSTSSKGLFILIGRTADIRHAEIHWSRQPQGSPMSSGPLSQLHANANE